MGTKKQHLGKLKIYPLIPFGIDAAGMPDVMACQHLGQTTHEREMNYLRQQHNGNIAVFLYFAGNIVPSRNFCVNIAQKSRILEYQCRHGRVSKWIFGSKIFRTSSKFVRGRNFDEISLVDPN